MIDTILAVLLFGLLSLVSGHNLVVGVLNIDEVKHLMGLRLTEKAKMDKETMRELNDRIRATRGGAATRLGFAFVLAVGALTVWINLIW